MPKGVYKRTEQHKKRIGESRKKYFDEHGRVVNINQKDSPEAYREYQREYQKIWRKKNPHYYRDLKIKQKEVQEMNKLQEIQNACDIFISKSIELEYKTSSYNEDELKKLADDVSNKITNYLEETKNEREEKDEDKV